MHSIRIFGSYSRFVLINPGFNPSISSFRLTSAPCFCDLQGLGDGHTSYMVPTGYYTNFMKVFPFGFAVVDDGLGGMAASTVGYTTLGGGSYDTLCGCSLAIGTSSVIKTINGLSFQNYMQQIGDEIGVSRDPGQRVGRAMGSYPARLIGYGAKVPTTNENYVIVFDDDYTLTVPVVWYVPNAIASITSLRSQIFRTVTAASAKRTSTLPHGLPQPMAYVEVEKPLKMMWANLSLEYFAPEKKTALPLAVTLTQLYGGSTYGTYCYKLSDNSAIIFRLDSFAFSMDFDTWVPEVLSIQQSCVTYAKDYGISKLIIDLRANGGGFVA